MSRTCKVVVATLVAAMSLPMASAQASFFLVREATFTTSGDLRTAHQLGNVHGQAQPPVLDGNVQQMRQGIQFLNHRCPGNACGQARVPVTSDMRAPE
jgi:hypothetical protein